MEDNFALPFILGTRFNTICHGDMWMGNLMFSYPKPATEATPNGDHANSNGSSAATGKSGPQTGDPNSCYLIDFHSAQYLSPATDLAHLLLTSTTRAYRQAHWDEV